MQEYTSKHKFYVHVNPKDSLPKREKTSIQGLFVMLSCERALQITFVYLQKLISTYARSIHRDKIKNSKNF